MKFYLPNFEDLVDPGYDFIHDEPSPERENRFLHNSRKNSICQEVGIEVIIFRGNNRN
jgi:hypothetical protein